MKKMDFILKTALVVIVLCMTNYGWAQSVRLNHIAVHVKNLKVSRAFYTGIIGLDTIPEPFKDGLHCWLEIGHHKALHLIEFPGQTPVVPGKYSHLCFSVAKIPEVTERLSRLNISYESWEGVAGKLTLRKDGVTQLYFQDPDGYWIEINDAKQ